MVTGGITRIVVCAGIEDTHAGVGEALTKGMGIDAALNDGLCQLLLGLRLLMYAQCAIPPADNLLCLAKATLKFLIRS